MEWVIFYNYSFFLKTCCNCLANASFSLLSSSIWSCNTLGSTMAESFKASKMLTGAPLYLNLWFSYCNLILILDISSILHSIYSSGACLLLPAICSTNRLPWTLDLFRWPFYYCSLTMCLLRSSNSIYNPAHFFINSYSLRSARTA